MLLELMLVFADLFGNSPSTSDLASSFVGELKSKKNPRAWREEVLSVIGGVLIRLASYFRGSSVTTY
jgi:hypothetical protein